MAGDADVADGLEPRFLRQMEVEPLLPIEKQLIAWSLVVGAGLLGILLWISHTFFPG